WLHRQRCVETALRFASAQEPAARAVCRYRPGGWRDPPDPARLVAALRDTGDTCRMSPMRCPTHPGWAWTSTHADHAPGRDPDGLPTAGRLRYRRLSPGCPGMPLYRRIPKLAR